MTSSRWYGATVSRFLSSLFLPLSVPVVAFMNAHNGNGGGQGCHECGVHNTQGNFAATVAHTAALLLAAYGVFCRCVLCFHAVLMPWRSYFCNNGCFFHRKSVGYLFFRLPRYLKNDNIAP